VCRSLVWWVRCSVSPRTVAALRETARGLGFGPNGTAFTVFLDTLNNKCDGDESTLCIHNQDCRGIGHGKCGHAGFRHWRLPHIKELQSLVDFGVPEPAPTVDATFPGATAGDFYWSSTPDAFREPHARIVDFFDVSRSPAIRRTRFGSVPCVDVRTERYPQLTVFQQSLPLRYG